MDLSNKELEEFLNEKYNQYNKPSFIDSDPIQIPHRFSIPEDIEIAAFLTASIAWGNRKMIIRNAGQLMDMLDNSPFDFICNASKSDLKKFADFKHRTFNSIDLVFFIESLKNIFQNHNGLQSLVCSEFESVKDSLARLRKVFFSINFPDRTAKHISDVNKNSAAKRLNMFLMWMVRNDGRGVHFGLWDKIPAKELKLPLDVHTANVGRKLGLITRTQNDWQTVEEVTENLKKFDINDPVKYDFALFGLGVFEKF